MSHMPFGRRRRVPYHLWPLILRVLLGAGVSTRDGTRFRQVPLVSHGDLSLQYHLRRIGDTSQRARRFDHFRDRFLAEWKAGHGLLPLRLPVRLLHIL